jgi:hypothetical protein
MLSMPICSTKTKFNSLDISGELNRKDKSRRKDHRLQYLVTDAQYLALRGEEIANGLSMAEVICSAGGSLTKTRSPQALQHL